MLQIPTIVCRRKSIGQMWLYPIKHQFYKPSS
nr:MAG TPA: hypothetical protein [Caudoviricetes sp.]